MKYENDPMSMQCENDLFIFFEEIYAFFFDHVVMLGDFR